MQQSSEKENKYCTRNNFESALSMLSEELDSLGLRTVTANSEQIESLDGLTDISISLLEICWTLIRKHRSLMKTHDQLNDLHCKVSSDNTALKNRVKRFREDLEKNQQVLSQVQERERRLKVQCESMSRELSREKNEISKLRKQLRSKDTQHEHELRRVTQNGQKLREQLEKSIGSGVPRNVQKVRADHQKELNVYKQTIARLEENNRQMLEEIHELRENLSLHRAGIDLHIEASGIWTETETSFRAS